MVGSIGWEGAAQRGALGVWDEGVVWWVLGGGWGWLWHTGMFGLEWAEGLYKVKWLGTCKRHQGWGVAWC